MNNQIKYINSEVLKLAAPLNFTVADKAPATEIELFNSTGLVIWSGESDKTIYQDAKVNFAFRAIHDNIHLETRLDFSPDQEIEMGRIQAARLNSRCKSFLADLFYCEISLQALYYKQNGVFVPNQIDFAKQFLNLEV